MQMSLKTGKETTDRMNDRKFDGVHLLTILHIKYLDEVGFPAIVLCQGGCSCYSLLPTPSSLYKEFGGCITLWLFSYGGRFPMDCNCVECWNRISCVLVKHDLSERVSHLSWEVEFDNGHSLDCILPMPLPTDENRIGKIAKEEAFNTHNIFSKTIWFSRGSRRLLPFCVSTVILLRQQKHCERSSWNWTTWENFLDGQQLSYVVLSRPLGSLRSLTGEISCALTGGKMWPMLRLSEQLLHSELTCLMLILVLLEKSFSSYQ